MIGAGVVGCAVALALGRRGASVALLEAEDEPGLAASGTNSGILHTGFDSVPGELETDLILRAARLRDPVLEALGVPVLRCGAVLQARDESQHAEVRALARNAVSNGVEVVLSDGQLEVPGEAVTDPVAYTLALAAAAVEHGAELRKGFRVEEMEERGPELELTAASGEAVRCRLAVNCAGLHADEVARLAGDERFEIYPRKGEFLVYDVEPPEHILLPVPEHGTKGVLVFPTLDGRTVAGPTAVDGSDKRDWSVRAEARAELMPKAEAMYPALAGVEPSFAYAGLRPAGRGANYVVGPSPACPLLLNAAAIRSTGLTASLGIADHVVDLVAEAGVGLEPEQPLRAGRASVVEGPWWRRTAGRMAVAS